MVKIKTLIENLKNGQDTAFKKLDEQVEALGDIKIRSVQDTFYSIGDAPYENTHYAKRIVIYNDTNLSMKGESWKPDDLDMNLKDFASHLNLSKELDSLVMDCYNYGNKKTLREFLATPKIWFKHVGFLRGYRKGRGKEGEIRRGSDNWEHLKYELEKYGLKLLEKGNLIKD